MKSEPTRRPRSRFRKYFALGALFELLLIVSAMGLPESNLAVEVRNFVLIVHSPLMFLAFGNVVFLIVGFLVMASIWGFFFLQVAHLAGWFAAHLNRTQKMAGWVIVGIGAITLLAQAVVSALPQKPIPFDSSPEIKAVADGNNVFALDLYQKLRTQPGNLFFSPFSLSSALAITAAGARGQTELEMTNALHLGLPPEKLHPAFRALIARMDRVQRWNRIILKSANSLWCQQDYHFLPDFLKLVRENYSAEAKSVDFKHSPASAANEINHWVDAKTDHRIAGAMEPDKLTPDTSLVLCNAVYFKGKWLHQFKEKDTQPAPFHVTTNETVTVPMMSQGAEFKSIWSEDGSVQMLELPYSGQDLSMVILLPTEYGPDAEGNSLSGLEQQLTFDNLRTWLTELDRASPHKTYVSLPRFTTTSSFNLTNELKSLGMTSAFGDTADFSGMDGTKYLYLSDVVHKAFVDVNEAGTEAAAVTLVLIKTKGSAGRFYVDHPFIFLIRENGSGSILFLGRIIDPTK